MAHNKPNNLDKLQKVYAGCKKTYNKASNFVFLFTVLVIVTILLFANLPDSADRSWFIAFCLLGTVFFGAWIAALGKKQKQQDKNNRHR